MKNEYLLNTKNTREQIKYFLALRGLTLSKLKNLINEKFNRTDKTDNLSRKLINKTLRLTEFIEIVEVLDFEIILRDKNNNYYDIIG